MQVILNAFWDNFHDSEEYAPTAAMRTGQTRWLYDFAESFQLYRATLKRSRFVRTFYGRNFLALRQCPTHAELFLAEICPDEVVKLLSAISRREFPPQSLGPEYQFVAQVGLVSSAGERLQVAPRGRLVLQRFVKNQPPLQAVVLAKLNASKDQIDENARKLETIIRDIQDSLSGQDHVIRLMSEAQNLREQDQWLLASFRLLDATSHLAHSLLARNGFETTEQQGIVHYLDTLHRLLGVGTADTVELIETAGRSLEESRTEIENQDPCTQIVLGYAPYEAFVTCIRELVYSVMLDDI